MTTFPLNTLACTIDATGISAPPYADILTSLQTSYRNIYGQDVNLDADTQDGQFLAIIAAAINDSNNATIAAFNAQSPSTAQGAGLSSVVKLNGLTREASSNSSVDVTIVGVAGTQILNGVVGDSVGLNTRWDLFPAITIPDSGTLIVTAICETPGNITAEIGTITKILTPVIGWQTANNATAASPGNPVEDDATLRQRQSISQGQPAQSPFSASLAAIANLPGVTRSAGYENATGSVDGNGLPANAVSFVVGGGDVNQIARTIERKKTLGTPTYGSTAIDVIDPSGNVITINFFVLALTEFPIVVTINPLPGYSDTTALLIQQALVDYINALPIGGTVYLTKAEAIASLMDSPLNLTFDVTALTLNGVAADKTIAFNHAASIQLSDVTVNI